MGVKKLKVTFPIYNLIYPGLNECYGYKNRNLDLAENQRILKGDSQ